MEHIRIEEFKEPYAVEIEVYYNESYDLIADGYYEREITIESSEIKLFNEDNVRVNNDSFAEQFDHSYLIDYIMDR